MICSRCGFTGSEDNFTKGNRSHSGNVGRCKKCKADVDAEYRQKQEQKALESFALEPDLLKRQEAKIGVLMLHRVTDRQIGKGFLLESNFGLKAILSELNENYELCYPETINEYRTVLISLSSVMDVENLIYTFRKYCPDIIEPTVVVGGFGVINIKLIAKHIDVAVFGRAEGQINAIIAGYNYNNVWRKVDDPDISRQYVVRQPRYILKGEKSIGCRFKCRFCQYTHVRKPIGNAVKYNPGDGLTTQETDWRGLDVTKGGRYISAWDGWSDATRKKAGKPVTNNDITDKLIAIGNDRNIKTTVTIKIFQIVGYPWETRESVEVDIKTTTTMIAAIDKQITNKLVLAFLVTPFGPEPLTPMQYDKGSIDINWNELLAGRKLYYGNNIKAFIITAISGPYTLLKRMMINRAEGADYDMFCRIAYSSKLKALPERHKVKWILCNTELNPEMFGQVESAGFDYLSIP